MTARSVAVGLCDGIAGRPELVGLQARLEAIAPDVRVELVHDLCRHPELVPSLAERTGAGRIVLGLCRPRADRTELQAWARKAGLDPFALEIVAPLEGSSDAPIRLAAAAARLGAFPGSDSEQMRLKLLSLEGRVSRRSLFTLPPFTYEAVPSVDEEACLGSRRCGLCVPACPVAAIHTSGTSVDLDRDRCAACGICVSTCPVEAIGLPGASLAQYEAELSVLAESGQAVALTCRRDRGQSERLGPGWVPVEVPCLGMVTPGWMLQTLAAGARAVALGPCGDGCGLGQQPAVESRVGYVRALLRLFEGDEGPPRVVFGSALSVPPGGGTLVRRPGRRAIDLCEPSATVTAARELAARVGAGRADTLAHDGSPLGLVEVRADTCTVCGACADACPTEALAHRESVEAATISFDPASCLACNRCVPVCPEGASETIRLSRVTDLGALARGRTELKRDPVALCRNCARPVAPRAMLERIRQTLETEEESAEPLLSVLSELCSDCRGLAT